jgi:hypothetical protein
LYILKYSQATALHRFVHCLFDFFSSSLTSTVLWLEFFLKSRNLNLLVLIFILRRILFFFKLFFTLTPHIPRFDFWYTVIIPAAPQETVEEAGIESGTAALQSGSPSRALANWATTSPILSHHIPKLFICIIILNFYIA